MTQLQHFDEQDMTTAILRCRLCSTFKYIYTSDPGVQCLAC